jgi:hypothetical protein
MFCKYVMIDGTHPVFFFRPMKHKDLAALGNVTSAGFVMLVDGQDPLTLGTSTTLDMSPNENDAKIIKQAILEGSL